MRKYIFITVFISVMVGACGGDGGTSQATDNFDREAMMTNIADNIIIPAQQDFKSKMEALNSRIQEFIENPSVEKLTTVRNSWYITYKAWQHIEMFNIGKAEEIQYSFYMNIYPLNVADVNDNITNGNYDLSHVNNQDAQGFPALDYLLYGIGATDNEILAKYTTGEKSASYKKYLDDVSNRMLSLTTVVVNDWNTYRDLFISSTENTATSAVNKLANDFVFYCEKGFRANKIGIPSGVWSTEPLPEKVEAFFNKNISKPLALEAFRAIDNVFNGKKFNGTTSGESFKTYLNYLNSIKENTNLSQLINNQLAIAKGKIDLLNDNFYQQIINDNQKMTLAYDEIQKVIILLKVDMLQAFNISVDYVDADGD